MKSKKKILKKKRKKKERSTHWQRPPAHDPHHARPLVHRNAHAHAFLACIHYSLLYVYVINS